MQVGVYELGGNAVILEPGGTSWTLEHRDGVVMDGDKTEHLAEFVRVLERYTSAIGVRTFAALKDWETERTDPILGAFAKYSSKPVINLESAMHHPCQSMADMMTIREKLGPGKKRVLLTWAWHPKTLPMAVPNSFALASAQFGHDLTIAHPAGYELDGELIAEIKQQAANNGGSVEFTNDVDAAFDGVEAVYAKSWGGKGFYGSPEADIAHRLQFRDRWIVDSSKMARTSDAIFMHSPARASKRHRDRRGHRFNAIGRDRRGREPASRPKGHYVEAHQMNIGSLDLLREALPYIQRFKGMTFVVKFSGKVTEDKENLASLAEELALLHQVGIRICVIHGGGKQLNELARKLGVVQTVIEGRRVTDDDTLELAKMIFRGKINTEILAQFRRRGIHAVGLSGIDGGVVKAVKRPPRDVVNRETGATESIDFGHVGDIVEIDATLINTLLDSGYVPVISSLGADDDGKVFNINADTIAAEIAASLGAEKLILLSDVNGIYLEPGREDTKISRLTVDDAREMIASGRATGGMIPKLQNLVSLLERGVHSAHVIGGTTRNALLAEVFTDEGTGTMVVRD